MRSLKKCIQVMGDTWLIIGIAVGLLVFVELGLTLAFYLKDRWLPPPPNFRQEADTHSDRAWAIRYYEEIKDVEKWGSVQWRPYVYWRRLPRQGEFINITEEGVRKTTNLPINATPTKKVFMFGGSTMWGYGAADSETIPSLLAKEIRDKGVNCEVINFGQYAYVSTQGVVELMRQLQQGVIPDVVVFYDGANDVFSAFQLGLAGLPHDEHYREKEFNLLRKPDIYLAAAKAAIGKLAVVRLGDGVLKRIGVWSDDFQPVSMKYEKPITDKTALAQKVVNAYLNNVKLVHALSKSYGFTYVFYWQPLAYTKPNLTEYERKSLELYYNYPGMREFYLEVYKMMRHCSGNLEREVHFYNLDSIFQDVREPIYTDFNHMGEKGNRIIAQRMMQNIEPHITAAGKAKFAHQGQSGP